MMLWSCKLINCKRLLVFALTCLLFLSGCIRNASDNPSSAGNQDESTGDFRVINVTGKSTITSRHAVWRIPTEKTYEFRACLQGRNTVAQLPIGQEFSIKSPDGTSVVEKTDEVGCINWREVVKFNYGGDSFYIEKRRRIEGRGVYRGTSLVRIAVNPWLEFHGDAGDEVVDLNRGNTNIPKDRLVKEEVSGETFAGLFSRESNRSLRIDLMPGLENISVGDRGDGKSLSVYLQLKPYLEPLNMNEQQTRLDIKNGKFKVYAQFVGDEIGESHETGVGEHRMILTPELSPKDGIEIKTDGTIVFKAENIPLRRQITSGNVKLAIKVVPQDAPLPMNAYEGLYQVGEFEQIFGKKWVTNIKGTQDNEGFSYGDYLRETTNFEDLKKAQWAHDLPAVEYSPLEPRFVQVKEGETSTDRTVIYRVSTQVTDGVDNTPIRKQPIQIILPDGSRYLDPDTGKDPMTDHNGYLYWRDELPHKYYERERRIFEQVSFIHKRSNRKDTFTIALNPWDEGWTFGGDLRTDIVEKDYKFLESEKKPNRLMIDAFRYQTIRFRYVIDEFLTLNVKKAVVMALDPLVQRDTLYRGRIFEPLRDGVYLAKIALVKYYIDPFKNGLHLVKCKDNPEACEAEGANPSNDTYHVMKVSDAGEKNEDGSRKYDEARKGQYTTVIKKLLRVQAGRITTPLEFSMRDLRMMSIRSQIMVQLETIDERRLLRDNIVYDMIAELEREYFQLNTDQMTDEDKERLMHKFGEIPKDITPRERDRIIQQRGLEIQDQINDFKDFLADSRSELEKNREKSQQAQMKRFDLADKIEKGLQQGSSQKLYEEFNPLINLPRDQFKDEVRKALGNLNKMELVMKEYWSEWDKPWTETLEEIQNSDNPSAPKLELRRTYTDYALVMQQWLMGENLPIVITNEDYDRLKINNYTANPVAPLVDLNYYRNDSGLTRRTFIGPCTLVENDNMSEMRPTDTIDEQFCDYVDCSQEIYQLRNPLPDNKEFEESAHHDSLKPFASMHVDEVVTMHKENERRYEMEMDALSQFGFYTKAFNLNFVSLTDQPIYDYKQGCSFAARVDCFEETTQNVTPSNDFIDRLNERDTRELISRYFMVNPLKSLVTLNKEVNERRKDENKYVRQNALEPLWKRAARDAGGLRNMWKIWNDKLPLDYIPFPSAMEYETMTALAEDALYYPGDVLLPFQRDTILYMNRVTHYQPKKLEKKKVEKSDVSRWLREGMDKMKLEDALRICYALSSQASEELYKTDLIVTQESEREGGMNKLDEYLLHKCFARVRFLPNSNQVYFDGIHFDRRYKILKAGRYEHIAGMNMNVNVGVEFGIGSYEDISSTASHGISDAGVLGLGPALIGLGIAAVGLVSTPVIVAGGAAVAAVGGVLVFSKSSSKSDGVAIEQGQAVSAATFLVVQKADFELEVLSHEKCVNLSFGREFLADLDGKTMGLKYGTKPSNSLIQKAVSRGYMVCDGKPTDKPEKINESYYYVTQHFTAGDMLDDVNLLNHVWLLSLRGKRDFNEFVRILKSKKVNEKGEVIDDGQIYDYPLSRLGQAYRQVIPTFPGLYSVRD